MPETVYDALRESHETQRSLCRRLLRSRPGTRERLDLFTALRTALQANGVHYAKAPVYRAFRAGDVRHSQADVSKAQRLLGYAPSHDLLTGIAQAMPWYIAQK